MVHCAGNPTLFILISNLEGERPAAQGLKSGDSICILPELLASGQSDGGELFEDQSAS